MWGKKKVVPVEIVAPKTTLESLREIGKTLGLVAFDSATRKEREIFIKRVWVGVFAMVIYFIIIMSLAAVILSLKTNNGIGLGFDSSDEDAKRKESAELGLAITLIVLVGIPTLALITIYILYKMGYHYKFLYGSI